MPVFDNHINTVVYTLDDYYPHVVKKYPHLPKFFFKKMMNVAFKCICRMIIGYVNYSLEWQKSETDERRSAFVFCTSLNELIKRDTNKKTYKTLNRLKGYINARERNKFKDNPNFFKISDEKLEKILERHATKYKHLLERFESGSPQL